MTHCLQLILTRLLPAPWRHNRRGPQGIRRSIDEHRPIPSGYTLVAQAKDGSAGPGTGPQYGPCNAARAGNGDAGAGLNSLARRNPPSAAVVA
jgi:hypothetical protein